VNAEIHVPVKFTPVRKLRIDSFLLAELSPQNVGFVSNELSTRIYVQRRHTKYAGRRPRVNSLTHFLKRRWWETTRC